MCAFGPVLEGERISLRPPRREDLALYRRWLANPDITRYFLEQFTPSAGQEEEWYVRVSSSTNQVVWRIVLEEQTIGNTGIHGIDWINRHGETGLMIGEMTVWGRGYAGEAVRLRTRYAFEELGLERLGSVSFVTNKRMHRALERSGYRKIGQRHHIAFRDGAWQDAYILEMLREDWPAHGV